MVYAALADIEGRIQFNDLVQITNNDPTAQVVNTAFVDQALADASAEIDGYLATRFALPLTDPPVVLNRLCCDIAIYRLQSLMPLHDVLEARTRYEDAIKMLEDVAAGKLSLGLAADNVEPGAAAGSAVVRTPADPTQGRIFTRTRLRGF